MTKTQNTKFSSPQKTHGGTTFTSRSGQSHGTQKKRNRWHNKKHRSTQRQPRAIPVGPAKQYISNCCNAPARKPPCGKKVDVIDPETKKSKEEQLGLGKWRCSVCGKPCAVKPRKPVIEEPAPAPTTPPEAQLATT